ncbi:MULTISPECIES: YopX family protein [Rhodococcus]|uniref:YopX family protein n=1 Tax=Rhodococcus TaxID=1827 RepID=UPI000A6083C9|nr:MULTISPECIES: YopX family protein [Rhodococcus]MCJ0950375.1 YopX family protein [Rhodococcus sp. ARC_M8]QEX10865.1 hypothetical protein F6X56_14650 [Rhodococcus erythropolis]UKO88878.1 YopX family protein [Rhodococcus erythropolis]BBE45457.1 hypothetical protein RE2895_23880 [Rhodococcus erythropolis]
MKQLKLRALARGGNKWIYTSPRMYMGFDFINMLDPGNGKGGRPSTVVHIRPETAGLFTGLRDTRGLDIFQGDLLEDPKGRNGALHFGSFDTGDQQGVGFFLEYEDRDTASGVVSFGADNPTQSNYRIVGSIHTGLNKEN